MKKRFSQAFKGNNRLDRAKKGEIMRSTLLERQLREKEYVLEKSILLQQGKRDEYIINKENLRKIEALGELYQRKRRALG